MLLAGGSRSGKTFIECRASAFRAIAAKRSRHAILRFRFNAVKHAVVLDTFPKMMEVCFPSIDYEVNRTDWYARLQNDSEVWFGGLDDKERTEKILGQEYATLQFNECSQIPYSSVVIARTRLAQLCRYEHEGMAGTLRLKALYDENPPSMGHWSYREFVQRIEPESGKPLLNPADYAMLFMNPDDNRENLPADYIASLEAMPARMRDRFLYGKFASITDNALWSVETIDRWRSLPAHGLPDMQRVVVAVDPSGSGDEDNASNDEIGIVVAGLGMDGNGYVLEDLTCKTGPKGWGTVATTAYDRHSADLIVGEGNFGGDMVRFVVQAAKPNVPFKKVTASRGKAVRAEPISALTEQGRIRFAGTFPRLEDELCSFTTAGFLGDRSPNRADAFVWAMSELFPGIANPKTKPDSSLYRPSSIGI